MKIRIAKPEDARAIITLNKATIRKVNSKDYSKSIIAAWSGVLKTAHTKKRLAEKNRKTFVAIENNKIVGFISLDLEKQIIKALYVDHKQIGKGIGKKLLAKGEKELKKLEVKVSKIHGTFTAEGFYKSQGYKKIKLSKTTLAGIEIEDVLMKKKL